MKFYTHYRFILLSIFLLAITVLSGIAPAGASETNQMVHITDIVFPPVGDDIQWWSTVTINGWAEYVGGRPDLGFLVVDVGCDPPPAEGRVPYRNVVLTPPDTYPLPTSDPAWGNQSICTGGQCIHAAWSVVADFTTIPPGCYDVIVGAIFSNGAHATHRYPPPGPGPTCGGVCPPG